MKQPLRCACGSVSGSVANPHRANRVICYCRDCQAFARFLGREAEVLDARGGSQVIQTLPRNVSIERGLEQLACVRLSEKGLLRWYAACCRSPIGNTLPTAKMSFVGLVSTCVETPEAPAEAAFGPVRCCVNTEGAIGEAKPAPVAVGTLIRWFIVTTLLARLRGDWRTNPFFDVETDRPIARPTVLSPDERERLRAVHPA